MPKVARNVDYFLTAGADLAWTTATEELDEKWKQYLSPINQKKRVVCYGIVDLLLLWWQFPDALRRGFCFALVRMLIGLGCDGPTRYEDRVEYRAMCKERGLVGIHEDVDDGFYHELSRGFEL